MWGVPSWQEGCIVTLPHFLLWSWHVVIVLMVSMRSHVSVQMLLNPLLKPKQQLSFFKNLVQLTMFKNAKIQKRSGLERVKCEIGDSECAGVLLSSTTVIMASVKLSATYLV